jgi:hypothetical protein
MVEDVLTAARKEVDLLLQLATFPRVILSTI